MFVRMLLRWVIAACCLLVGSANAQNVSPASVPQIDLSTTQGRDIMAALDFYQLPQQQLPSSLAELQQRLPTLQPQQQLNTFGDRFFGVVQLHNDTQESAWFVRPFGSVVEHIEVRLLREQGGMQQFSTGHSYDNEVNAHYGGSIELAPGQRATLLILFESRFFWAPIKLNIGPQDQLKTYVENKSLVLMMSLGICLALGIYNLFLYIGTRQNQYLFYSLSTLSFMFGWMMVYGFGDRLFGMDTSRWITLPLNLSVVFSALFFIHFLQLDKYSPKLSKSLKILSAIAVLTLFIAPFNHQIAILLVSLTSTVLIVLGATAGIKSWRRGYSPARFFVLGLLCVITPNLISSLLNLGILPPLNLDMYFWSQLGSSADNLLLAFALAEKVRLLNQENIDLANHLEQKVERRTQALSEANSRLIEVSNAKGQFLANMSHEIRTPLTSIIGYADAVIQGEIDSTEQTRVLKIIAENGNHLLSIINDILDISKIEADKIDFEIIPTPLFSVLAQVESVVSRRARDKGLRFDMHYHYPLPAKLNTDPTRLRQILFNLTNNAIKFTEQGFVEIQVEIREQLLEVQVKDSGKGMSPEQAANLFKPFSQGDNTVNRKYGGTGLGLSISQRLAEGMGGQLLASSRVGEGSTFTLCLPVQVPDDVRWINAIEEIWEATPAQTAVENQLPDFAQAAVLLVDDHPSNRELVSLMLKRMNVQVTSVDSGKAALEQTQYQNFDLILMDIQMPEMDGIQTLKKLRAQGCPTPVIALTANTLKHEVAQYLASGFADHLAKPFVRTDFIQILQQYLTSDAFANGLLSQSEMLSLVRNYYQDLRKQLTEFQTAAANQDQQRMLDIAHLVKGSAGSFGFTAVGDKLAEIEQILKSDEQRDLAMRLQELKALSQPLLELPTVDIAQAVVTHGNDAGLFLQRLRVFLPEADTQLQGLKDAIDNQQVNPALVQLHQLLPQVQRLRLQNCMQGLAEIEQLLRAGVLASEPYSEALKACDDELRQVKAVLSFSQAA